MHHLILIFSKYPLRRLLLTTLQHSELLVEAVPRAAARHCFLKVLSCLAVSLNSICSVRAWRRGMQEVCGMCCDQRAVNHRCDKLEMAGAFLHSQPCHPSLSLIALLWDN